MQGIVRLPMDEQREALLRQNRGASDRCMICRRGGDETVVTNLLYANVLAIDPMCIDCLAVQTGYSLNRWNKPKDAAAVERAEAFLAKC